MKTVIGLFDDFSAAESAVASLTQHNIDRGDISVAGHNVGADQRGVPADVQQSDTRKQAMQDGAIAGAGTGAAIGAGVGGGVGLAAGLGPAFLPRDRPRLPGAGGAAVLAEGARAVAQLRGARARRRDGDARDLRFRMVRDADATDDDPSRPRGRYLSRVAVVARDAAAAAGGCIARAMIGVRGAVRGAGTGRAPRSRSRMPSPPRSRAAWPRRRIGRSCAGSPGIAAPRSAGSGSRGEPRSPRCRRA